MKPVRRLLVANRGEIAVRILRACESLGIESVVIVSQADRDSLPARMAGRAICIGPAAARDSYLKIDSVVHAAIATGCDALHPGYGFLAEQPKLAKACEDNGVVFVGPRSETVHRMGNKLEARQIAEQCGVPLLPGSKSIESAARAVEIAQAIGYPVLLKAAAGGGGRGMKVAHDADAVRSGFETASAEARAAFGDATLYMERFVANARHVEVQVLGDRAGNVIHLGERDCSVQRRYQKIIEESPAPLIATELRDRIRAAAVKLAREVGYESAGTLEFLVDAAAGEFYFLEMNTRIQVEHPVTEMVSGVDIVKEQIAIASGRPLSVAQSTVSLTGHAIEARVNAESPAHGFRPSPGRLAEWVAPDGPGIRVDTHCYPGYLVPPYYDSLLAKVIAHGADREQAIERLSQALDQFVILGVDTTIPFVRRLLGEPVFRAGRMHTRWAEDVLAGDAA